MTDVEVQVRRNEPAAAVPVRSVNIFSSNNQRSRRRNSRPRRSTGFILFRRQRQHFITRVYLLAAVFIALSVFQWVFIISNPIFVDFFKERYYISLMSGLTALFLVTFFALFFEARYIEPYNWIFAYLIVELETIGLLSAPLDSDLDKLAICLLATITINIIFAFIGIKFPRDLTQDITILIVFSLIFYIVASIILILLITIEMYYLQMFLIIGTIFLLMMYIMYVSQLIMGDRAGYLRWNDFILAALMVYFNFMLTLSSTLHLANELFY